MPISVFALFLLLSGIAALAYQVTWVRLLGLSLGSTSASVATVLAAFFTGLAAGSYFAERLLSRVDSPLKLYLVLEAIIGLSGLVLLPLLLSLDVLMAWLPGFGSMLVAKFVLAMLLFLVPTLCMGATFPVMAAMLVRSASMMGLRLSQLYAVNTAGAVAGALLSGFVTIPVWGLDGTIRLAAGLNFVIVLAGLLLYRPLERALSLSPGCEPEPDEAASAAFSGHTRQAAWVLFATGLVAIAVEVGWTKYLAIYTGSTIFGFAAILAIFLAGIALGSWLVRRQLGNLRHPARWMVFGLVSLGMALLLARAGLGVLPEIGRWVEVFRPGADQWLRYGLVLAILFPATLLFGALFPLSLALYCGTMAGVRSRVGRGYAINTLAGIAGSLLAGFVLIPLFGTDILLLLGALVILLFPYVFLRQEVLNGGLRLVWPALPALALAGIWMPGIDYQRLITAVNDARVESKGRALEPAYYYLAEGKNGVISAVSYDGKVVRLQNNGLNESGFNLANPDRLPLSESLLALLPWMLHEQPHTAFVVGFGGGVTAQAMSFTDLERIRVVELEPKVVEAVASLNGGVPPALRDPRVSLQINDARNALLVDPARYDIIASQPSHPWRAGAANLFTTEFFRIVRSRLNPGGMYSQWLNLFNMDDYTLSAILNSFYSVFPYGVSFIDVASADMILLGSGRPMRFDFVRMEQRLSRPRVRRLLRTHGIANAEQLLWYFGLSRREALQAAGGARQNTDTNLLSEVRLSSRGMELVADKHLFEFLRTHYHFDIGQYLDPDQAAGIMFRAGRYFLRWGDRFRANLAMEQLRQLDPALAARLQGLIERRGRSNVQHAR